MIVESERSNVPEMTVDEVSRGIRMRLESSFEHVRVRGELGRVSRAASGHLYADLKDDRSVLSLVMWKAAVQELEFVPEEGMEVVAQGRISTYSGRSSYQLIARGIRPSGIGALMQTLEARRRRLAAQGLFDNESKKPLLVFPSLIGVVTSPTGAVIEDILHRIEERFPTPVVLWPSLVQGPQAAGQIVAGIDGLNALGSPPDVIIVARGGGSIEDLWAFNEEAVVRAVYASAVPVISGVGHQTDTTLIDHVADVRAPTPTAAALAALPVSRHSVCDRLTDMGLRMRRVLCGRIESGITRLRSARMSADVFRRPRDRYAVVEQALRVRMSLHWHNRSDAVLGAGARLGPHLLREGISGRVDRLCVSSERLGAAIGFGIRDRSLALASLVRVLDSVSHMRTLERGYAVVRDHSGILLRRADQMVTDMPFWVEFADGRVRAVVVSCECGGSGQKAGEQAEFRYENGR